MSYFKRVNYVIEYARKRGIDHRGALLLAGIGVTHVYTPKTQKAPQRGSRGRYDTEYDHNDYEFI